MLSKNSWTSWQACSPSQIRGPMPLGKTTRKRCNTESISGNYSAQVTLSIQPHLVSSSPRSGYLSMLQPASCCWIRITTVPWGSDFGTGTVQCNSLSISEYAILLGDSYRSHAMDLCKYAKEKAFCIVVEVRLRLSLSRQAYCDLEFQGWWRRFSSLKTPLPYCEP